jgi:TonB family protein
MKRRWFWFCSFFVAVILLGTAFSSAQQADNDSSNTLAFENGTLVNGVYSNQCLGFSLPIPTGWDVNETVTPSGKARHRSDKSLVLLFLQQQGKLPGRIILSAEDSAGHIGDAQNFVSDAVHAQINLSTDKRELIRDTVSVDYGGRHFFRADYKVLMNAGTPLYMAYVYAKFRGYFIGETLAAASPEGLDEAANTLQQISFSEDQGNLKCVMSSNAATTSGDAKIATPQRVRVSSGVSTGLRLTKVNPQYPDDAKQARIQGTVVMQAEIDKEGNVEKLTLISGHPMLAPAALEAVKQWKYKPYLFNGQPVKVETQVIVNFTLSRF